jgi:hypothetical protein
MLEEVPLGEEILAGTFFLYEHPIIIMFDFGASHDFFSLAYTRRPGLLSILPRCLTLSALSKADWLLIRWPVKSHLSLLRECFRSLLLSWKGRGLMSFLV